MNGTSGFQEVRSSTSRSPIGSCTSNGIDSDQVPGTFSVLTISPRHQRKAGKGCQAVFMPRIPFLCQYWRKQGRANFSVTRRENR